MKGQGTLESERIVPILAVLKLHSGKLKDLGTFPIGDEEVAVGRMDKGGVLDTQILARWSHFFGDPLIIIRRIQMNEESVIEMLLIVVIDMEVELLFVTEKAKNVPLGLNGLSVDHNFIG